MKKAVGPLVVVHIYITNEKNSSIRDCRFLRLEILKMTSVNIPEEYMDVLLQEFAYYPIRLSHEEDPV